MAVEYRPIHIDDDEAILDLWTRVYPDSDRMEWRDSWHTNTLRLTQTYVAIEHGRVLATVVYWLRHIPDTNGTPTLVGLVSHVMTHPDARRQGHATCLLEQALEAMRRDGCAWSILFPSEEGRPLYARHAYRSFSIRYQEGRLTSGRLRAETHYDITPYDPLREADGWAPLEAIYAAYNATRPLTVVRTSAYWQQRAVFQFTRWFKSFGAVVFIARRSLVPHSICGYVLAHFHDEDYIHDHPGALPAFLVSEIGSLPGNSAVIPALLDMVGDEAARRGIHHGRIMLPDDPSIKAMTDRLFVSTLNKVEHDKMMARPLGAGWDAHTVEALFAAPDAHFWSIDEI
ncbi:MAG: GNAT family N-acetyltransferase [Herpetosiphonaceae bacterium]|nr:GNAT family N-acetyltransferase [Herpetosiphonaceae bacterium]